MEFRSPYSHNIRAGSDEGATLYQDFDQVNIIYRKRRFGSFWGTALGYVPILDVGAIQRLHWNINTWTDKEVFAWKEAHIANCNAIVIASAIFAGIGFSSLQLPNITDVHWTAHACFVCSMVLAVLSVTTATQQYQTVGMLSNAVQIRLWLSRGRPGPKRPAGRSHQDKNNEPGSIEENGQPHRNKYSGFPAFERLPLESSMAALYAINLPRFLLFGAVSIFIFGIALYEILRWTQLPDGGENRNIFIVFTLTVCICASYEFFLRRVQHTDETKRNIEFDTAAFGGYSPLRNLQKLEELQAELIAAREKILRGQSLDDSDLCTLQASWSGHMDQSHRGVVIDEAGNHQRQKRGTNEVWEPSLMAYPTIVNESAIAGGPRSEKS